MKKEIYPTARKEDLVIQETGEEVLVYDLMTNKAKCLNESSAFIWRHCDGNRSAREIAREMSQRKKTDVTEEYVAFALSELSKHRLIVPEFHPNNSISRRQLVKKIGLSSLIALPVIASLVAPVAAQTGSTCNVGVACTCAQTGMTVGTGNPCAPPGTGGCNSFSTCVCRANDNGNNFSGTCGL